MGGGVEKWRTEYGYGGDRKHVTPPKGGTATTTINDARGREVELRQYENPTPTGEYDSTSYTYTDAGKLETVTDPGGNTWHYTYDLRGRKTKVEDPDRGTTSYSYDAAGQMVSETDARGETLVYAYDALGRKTTTHSGSPDGSKLAEWEYDTALQGTGELASATRWMDGNAYQRKVAGYDSLRNPLKTETIVPDAEGKLAGTYTSYFKYAPDGSQDSRTYSSIGGLAEETVSHTHGELGNVLTTWGTMDNSPEYVSDTRYTSYGEVARVQMGETGNRAWQSYYYDEHTRRTERMIVDAEVPDPMQADLAYSYDPAGNVTSIADQPRGGVADVQCFRHDHLSRLTEAWTTGSQCSQDPKTEELGGPAPYWRSYTYDEVGNRLTETRHSAGGDTVREYSYEQQGHALNSVSTDGSTTGEFGYDATGNMTSRKVAGREQQKLEWSERGNLEKVSTPDGDSTEFVYDAEGERLLRRSPSGTTLYLDGQQLRLNATTGELSATRYYTHGDRTVAMRESGEGLTWLTSDHQGTSKLAIDADSLQTTRRRFLPFGASRGGQIEFPGEKGFVGGTIDASVGLTTLGARQYDPNTGRFISVDPVMDLTDPQQMHGYTYGNNNPATNADPSGKLFGIFGRIFWLRFSLFLNSLWEQSGQGAQRHSVGGGGSQNRSGGVSGQRTKSKSESDKEDNHSWLPMLKKAGHAMLDVAGMVPVVGNVADGANCGWYMAEGKKTDAALSCAAAVPGAGLAATAGKYGKRGWDAASGLRKTPGLSASRRKAACVPNSFVPGTAVLMADGSHEPIEDVEVGDRVVATDPETGETVSRKVVATITGQGEKDLVEVTVDTDGDAGDETGVVVATGEHPFWVDDRGRWVDAEDLDTGDQLRTPDGELVEITDTREWAQARRVHNLSIAGVHTYHAVASDTPVLVHNSDCGPASKYKDTTRPGARMLNKSTDVGPEEFGKNLEMNGWARTDKGPNIMYEKDGARYFLRGKANSHEGWTADYYNPGSKKADIKIRLGED
nr:polymorphic toxin-type HINT domain-containing protein [Actinopolyspora biskrensis]